MSEANQYVAQQRKLGRSDQDIINGLVANGWSIDDATKQVSGEAVPAPPSTSPPPPPTTTQTGADGTPLQVENVQYNMKVKTVRSKLGVMVRIQHFGIWIAAFCINMLASAIISMISGGSGEANSVLIVVAISGLVPATGLIYVGNKKLHEEMRANPVGANDDLFYKRTVRASLWASIAFTVINIFILLFNTLGAMFIEDYETEMAAVLGGVASVAIFGSLALYFFKQNAVTKR